MATNNSAQDNQMIIRLINSDLFKTFITLSIFVSSTIGYLYTVKNEIDRNFLNLEHKLELQNIQIENRLRNVEETQDRNFKYIVDNYIKKSDLVKLGK